MDRLSELGTTRGFAERRVERARHELTVAEAECANATANYEAYAAETGECFCWVDDVGTRHHRVQHPGCPQHPVVEQRHLADGLRVAAPVQPEMDALRAALAVWADKLDWEPTGSLGCGTAYEVAEAARAVLSVYDEQVAAMERARNFHVNEAMMRKLAEG